MAQDPSTRAAPSGQDPAWDAGELEDGVTVTHRFELAAPATQVVASCPCFRTKIVDDRHLEVTLSTKSLIGRNDKTVHVMHANDKSTSLVIRFDVTTTKRVDRPQLSLVYASMRDVNPMYDVFTLAQKRNCTYEVRCADRLGRTVDIVELRDGETTWTGPAALDALKRLRKESGFVEATDPPPTLPPAPADGIPVYFFYSASCGECVKLLERELPAAFAKHPRLKLVPLEISKSENLRLLVGVLIKFDRRENTLPGLLAGDRYLNGFDAIRRDLEHALAAAQPAAMVEADPAALYSRLTIPAILLAGLIDGLNPCAFATAVLLAGFLAARRRSTTEIVLAGGLFTLAVFTTYLALGYLLASVATRLTGTLVNVVTACIAAILAIVSLRDAVVYAKTGEADRVALQLPDAVKRHVHAAMGTMRAALVIGSLMAGVVVTLLEAVCTGQLYVPVIVAMTRQSAGAHGLLVLYCAAFIVPLIVVLAIAIAGVRSKRLVEWSKRNVVIGKIAMAVVLLGMAAYLVVPLVR